MSVRCVPGVRFCLDVCVCERACERVCVCVYVGACEGARVFIHGERRLLAKPPEISRNLFGNDGL